MAKNSPTTPEEWGGRLASFAPQIPWDDRATYTEVVAAVESVIRLAFEQRDRTAEALRNNTTLSNAQWEAYVTHVREATVFMRELQKLISMFNNLHPIITPGVLEGIQSQIEVFDKFGA